MKKVFVYLLLGLFVSLPAFGAEQQAVESAQNSASFDFANGLYVRKMYDAAAEEYQKILSDKKEAMFEAPSRFRLGDCYFFLEQFADAKAQYEIFLKNFPKDERVQLAAFRLGASYFHNNEIQPAIATLEDLSKQKIGDEALNAAANYYLAESYEKTSRFSEAESIYRKISEQFPKSEYASFSGVKVGDTLIAQQKYDLALERYEASLGLQLPAELLQKAELGAGTAALKSGILAKAKDHFQKSYLSQANDQALAGLYQTFYESSAADEAENFYKANQDYIQNSQVQPLLMYYLGAGFFKNAQPEKALVYLRQSESHPKISVLLREQAILKISEVLIAGKDLDGALAWVQKLFDKPFESTATARFFRADIYEKMGRADEAMSDFLIVADTADAELQRSALYRAAIVQKNLKKFEEAKELFKKFVTLYPEDVNAANASLEAAQVELDAKKYQAALELLKPVIESKNNSTLKDIALYKAGLASFGIEDHAKAEEYYRGITDSLKDSSIRAEALWALSTVYQRNGKSSEAAASLEKILSEYPQYENKVAVYDRLGALYLAAGNNAKAADLYESSVLNDKSSGLVTLSSALWLCRYRIDQKQYDRAQKILDAMPKYFPSEKIEQSLSIFKAQLLAGQQKIAEAILQYDKTVLLNNRSDLAAYSYLEKGDLLARSGKTAEAEAALNEVLSYDNASQATLRARLAIGKLKYDSKQYAESAKAYMMAAVLYDDETFVPQALYQAADAYEKAGKPADAAKARAELIEKFPKNVWTQKVRSK